MNETPKSTGTDTKKQVEELGQRMLVQLERQERTKRYKDKLKWEGDLDEMRGSK